jgi:hypothetical protein
LKPAAALIEALKICLFPRGISTTAQVAVADRAPAATLVLALATFATTASHSNSEPPHRENHPNEMSGLQRL